MSLVHEIDYGTPTLEGGKRRSRSPSTAKQVTVPEGTSIMRAAMEMGTQIPKLCATDMVDAFGSCRLCLVEIEGRNGTPASCTTPVAPGMVVQTQTERLKTHPQGRDGALHLRPSARLPDLLGERRLRIAGHGGRGRPARRALRLRMARITSSPNPMARPTRTGCRRTSRIPYFTYDPSKCIVCSRCVRACEEVQGTFALTIAGRGFDSRVSPGMEESFLGSECVSCGACVQACPTATLNEKKVIEIGKPEHSVVTTCAYCGVGCSFKAEMRGEELVRMVPYKDGEANRGHSCVKGRFAWGYATHKERILKPMIRAKVTDPWKEVSWDEAINLCRLRVQAHPGQVRQEFRRRHHLVALHQ